MDHIKAVGKAIRNSPRALRKKLGHDQGHEKLDEDWYHSEDPVKAGVIFYVKYLGSTEVKVTHGPGSTDESVKRIVQDAQRRGGKLQKVQMTVSSQCVKLVDIAQDLKLDEIPLYRVSYCTVDPYYDKVFCYISRNHTTRKLDCHAFLCSKKSKAEAITLTVAQAFNIAFEKWQAAKKATKDQKSDGKPEEQKQRASNGEVPHTSETAAVKQEEVPIGVLLTSPQQPPQQQQLPQLPPPPRSPSRGRSPARQHSPARQLSPLTQSPQRQLSPEQHLPAIDITTQGFTDLNIGVTPCSPTHAPLRTNPFASFDDFDGGDHLAVKSTIPKAISLDYLQLDNDFDMEFKRLAEARSNPHLLAIGDHMNRTNMQDDVLDLMRGEKTADDLARSKSHEDLLAL